jgi:hypothetical protein
MQYDTDRTYLPIDTSANDNVGIGGIERDREQIVDGLQNHLRAIEGNVDDSSSINNNNNNNKQTNTNNISNNAPEA